ncbi:helix-turn-helix domain-containing protein [Shouchella rhizosphaerae]|uniref:helix-turn-helix domain-containing protein n=1 Tax=Shouchella rhizosphaerae TaxID=866786 RepID=UPI003F823C67
MGSSQISTHILYLTSISKLKITLTTSQAFTTETELLVFMKDGSGILSIDHTPHPLQTGQLYSVAAGTMLQLDSNTESEYLLVNYKYLEIKAKENEKALHKEDKCEFSPYIPLGLLPDAKKTETLKIQELYEAYAALDSSHIPLQHQLKFQELVSVIVRLSTENKQKNWSTAKGIEESIAYMQENLQHKINLPTLASIAKLTPNAYCRSFKQLTGQTPIEYLNELRISCAKRLLSEKRSVREVASQIGITDEFYFSRLFKKKVGLAPTIYTKRSYLRIATASYLDLKDSASSLGFGLAEHVCLFEFDTHDTIVYKRKVAEQLQRLRSARPDLIIADFFHSAFTDQLKQIAPTLVLEYTPDWKVLFFKLAELSGREQQALSIFNELEHKVRQTKERLRQARRSDNPIVLMYLHRLNVRIQGAVNHPLSQLIYQELRLPSGSYMPHDKHREDYSPTRIPPLPSDYNLFVHPWDRWTEINYWDTLKEKAECSNHTFYIGSDWLTLSWTPTGRKFIMNELLTAIQ